MTRFILALMTSCLFSAVAAETTTLLDFTNGKTHGYIGNGSVESVKGSKEGLVVVCKGDQEDPWIEGPALHNWPHHGFNIRNRQCFRLVTEIIRNLLFPPMTQ